MPEKAWIKEEEAAAVVAGAPPLGVAVSVLFAHESCLFELTLLGCPSVANPGRLRLVLFLLD